ncbi:hypothetical protein [Mycolicibacterium bacteremicum]|uniref:hypothetical protein n=1 Tax=Mycolicibacterium bacteremicum TaxID=564198 RepID=UPI0010567266|nr:hypothetical protein [Mycolicibacterium bacteremicum]
MAETPAVRVVPVAVVRVGGAVVPVVRVVPVAVELLAVVRVVPVAVELLAVVRVVQVAAVRPVAVLPVVVLSRLPAPSRVEERPVRRSNLPLRLRRSRSRHRR